MKGYADEVRKQMMELWGKTISQLEDISKTLMSTAGLETIKFDQAKLTEERDKLFALLGQEVFKLLEAGKVKVPSKAEQVYAKLTKVIEKLLKQEEATTTKTKVKKTAKKTKKAKKAAKKPAKKSVEKSTKKAKKTAKKPAKKAKKTAKKTSKK
jgi:hypothetical protein